MSKVININLSYYDNTACRGVDVIVGNFPHLSTKTDAQGKAVIIFPDDVKDIDISVNHITIYSGKVADIPIYGIIAQIP